MAVRRRDAQSTFCFRAARATGGICQTADEAAKIAGQIGFPVALKLASRTIVHKTEFGGVRLNLESEAAVRQAFLEIQQRVAQDNKLEEMDGVLIQPMISDGVEVMVGVTQDPLFGPLIGFGLGGIHVEILKDVCFRVTPITDRDAAEMVRSITAIAYSKVIAATLPLILPRSKTCCCEWPESSKKCRKL